MADWTSSQIEVGWSFFTNDNDRTFIKLQSDQNSSVEMYLHGAKTTGDRK